MCNITPNYSTLSLFVLITQSCICCPNVTLIRALTIRQSSTISQLVVKVSYHIIIKQFEYNRRLDMHELRLRHNLKLHKDKLWSLDYQRNLLATCSSDRSIKIVNLNHDRADLVDILDDTVHKKSVRSVAWRPESAAVLAAGSFDSTVSIWMEEKVGEAFSTMGNSVEMELGAIVEGHENEVKCVSWSHDGTMLATCSRDKSVWIWETDESGEEYECISVLQEHLQDVKHVVWHPSMALLASSSYDDTIRIWKENYDDWECTAVLTGHEGTVWCTDFDKSEHNLRLCSGSDDSTVRVWRYIRDGTSTGDTNQSWILEATLPSIHTRQIYSVSWGFNGLIASTGADGLLAVYKEVEPGQWSIIATKHSAHGVHEVNVIKWIQVRDRFLLLTGGDDGAANIWDYQ